MNFRRHQTGGMAGALFLLSLALRLAVFFPAASQEERLSRPDTSTYLLPAAALAETGTFPTTRRPPGFPLLAGAVFRAGGGVKTLAFCLTLIGALTTATVFFAGKVWGGNAVGLAAGILHALHPTAIGNAPLLLSDTPAGLFAALQLLFFLIGWQKNRPKAFYLSAFSAAIGAWIRPVNLLWFAPLSVLLLLMPQRPWEVKIRETLLCLLIFAAAVFPWLLRNHLSGAGWCMDTNTGAMYHQNGAMLLGAVTGRGYEAEQRSILQEQQKVFRDTARFPDERSREQYRMEQYGRLIREHFGLWMSQQISWHILLPDAPAVLEAWGITSSDRGTMAVMKSQGVAAAVRHYFSRPAAAEALLILSPLLLAAFVTAAGAFLRLAASLIRVKERWFEVLVFLAFAEYYLFLPGVITAPRYQLPALPCLCCMSALWLLSFAGKRSYEISASAEN